MMYTSPLFIITSLVLFFYGSEAAVTYYSHSDYVPPNIFPSYPQDSTNCCVIPTCDDGGRCYETLSCGYVCSQGNYRPASKYGYTPGYKLKEYYTKEDCHFGECKKYKFLCVHCPNPKADDFSIYVVRKDCKDCYY